MNSFITDYENRIAEFYFLLHRHNIEQSQILLYDLLRTLSYDLRKSTSSIDPTCEKQQIISYLRILYGFIGQTRDIYCGKGERDLAYMMIFTWYDFFPVLAIYAFYSFVFAIETTLYSCYPYGCWNDIKYFAKYILRTQAKDRHPLMSIIVSYANRQLRKDVMMHCDNDNNKSNVAKWIPRETKMKKLYELFVLDWFNISPDNANNISLSFLKKQYRQIITDQCSKHSKHTTNKNICKQIEQNKFNENNETVNGIGRGYFHENLFIGDYVRCALSIVKQCDTMNTDICCNDTAIWLNKKWQCILATFYKCYGGIPIIDIAKEISDENLFHAIGFACLIAEKSGIRRIMLVSDMPIWIDLTDTSNFCMIIQRIWSHCDNPLRRAARFDIAFNLIVQSIEHANLSILDNVKLFIFSDTFDFDWYNSIKQFNCKMSIIYWNIGASKKSQLRDVFAEDHRELIFMSGSNVALMNPFCNTEILPLNGPFYFIEQIMENARYKPLYDFFDTFIKEYAV